MYNTYLEPILQPDVLKRLGSYKSVLMLLSTCKYAIQEYGSFKNGKFRKYNSKILNIIKIQHTKKIEFIDKDNNKKIYFTLDGRIHRKKQPAIMEFHKDVPTQSTWVVYGYYYRKNHLPVIELYINYHSKYQPYNKKIWLNLYDTHQFKTSNRIVRYHPDAIKKYFVYIESYTINDNYDYLIIMKEWHKNITKQKYIEHYNCAGRLYLSQRFRNNKLIVDDIKKFKNKNIKFHHNNKNCYECIIRQYEYDFYFKLSEQEKNLYENITYDE